ncbi:MAG: prolipoprotein diacylglyceryl transferase [Anaerolineae bacterium]|nr:prolipoprotein diacylglyceryl transferase [Anaerolineae bacterium]
MTPPFDAILLEIGPFSIHWYGFLIVIGILLGTRVATYLAQNAGENPELIWDMLLICVLLGIIGARAYHVFSQPSSGLLGWSYYKAHPIEALYIWQGGLGIYGAIMGGAVGVLIFSWSRHLNPLQWLDFAAPGMAIGQAIGRWGNYINQELYGPPTTLPWGLSIPVSHRIQPYNDMTLYPQDTLFHPTFLYESFAALILCLLLLWVAIRYKDRLKDGDLLLGYLIGYSAIRFCTEFLRPDAWMMGKLATAQVIALILGIVGVLTVIAHHRLSKVQR